jgi:tripartite-type tricarboxylate transporter receptor subunit TctC
MQSSRSARLHVQWGAAAVALAISLAAPLSTAGAQTAASYPDKPVRIVNPFPPGSPVDAVGRLVALRLGTVWKQPVYVESHSGAGGTLGTAYVVNSPPDGTTLLVSTQSPVTVAPQVVKNVTYDPMRDLIPVWGVLSSGLVIVVNSALPIQTVSDLVAYAKANPKALAFASSGNGTVQHLAGELFKARTGAPLLHVPYRGGAPAANDLIAGQVQVMFDSVSNQIGYIRAGKVHALAVMRPTRAAALPDTPTLDEVGIKGADMRGYVGIFAPGSIPPAALSKLRTDIAQVMSGPQVRKQLDDFSMEGDALDADTFTRYVKEDFQQIREIVKTANITADAAQ